MYITDEETDGEALQSMADEERLKTIGVKKMGVRLKISNKIHALLKVNSKSYKTTAVAAHKNSIGLPVPVQVLSNIKSKSPA